MKYFYVAMEYFSSEFVTAAEQGNYPLIKKLYKQVSTRKSKNEECYFALYFAAFNGVEKIVQFFLSKNVNPNFVVGTYLTPLHAAVLKEHDKIVEILLNHGADVDPKIKIKTGYVNFIDL